MLLANIPFLVIPPSGFRLQGLHSLAPGSWLPGRCNALYEGARLPSLLHIVSFKRCANAEAFRRLRKGRLKPICHIAPQLAVPLKRYLYLGLWYKTRIVLGGCAWTLKIVDSS